MSDVRYDAVMLPGSLPREPPLLAMEGGRQANTPRPPSYNRGMTKKNYKLMMAYWLKTKEICSALGLTADFESEMWSPDDYICYKIHDKNHNPGEIVFNEHTKTWLAKIMAKPFAEGTYTPKAVRSMMKHIAA